MKKLSFLLLLSVIFLSCGTKKSEKENNSPSPSEQLGAASVYELEDFLAQGEALLDDTIYVRGHVKHTCKRAGKRCFLAGKDENVNVRVEAGGDIGGFNKELMGSEIIVRGIVRERHIEKAFIAEQEKALSGKVESGEKTLESCHSDFRKFEDMKKWMKENKKDYFPIYYLDGLSYELQEDE